MTVFSFGDAAGRRKAKGDSQFPTDPVRAQSWDINDPKANPGRRVLDGSAEAGWAFVDALRQAAKLLHHDHIDNSYEGPHRVHRSYLAVIDGVLGFLDFKTGQLTAAYVAIAAKARVHTNTAKRAIEAFEYWGLIGHVRRSEKIPDADKTAGPQRRQASNAYFFDCRREMPRVLWQKFWSRLVFNLRRLGNAAVRRASLAAGTFNEKARQAPRGKGEMRNLLAQIERSNFRGDIRAPWASAST